MNQRPYQICQRRNFHLLKRELTFALLDTSHQKPQGLQEKVAKAGWEHLHHLAKVYSPGHLLHKQRLHLILDAQPLNVSQAQKPGSQLFA